MEVMPFYVSMTWKRLTTQWNIVLLCALHEAGVNCKAWRMIASIYNNLHAVVKSGTSYSFRFPISRGVQQGSLLSPTFFLVVMDKLLC